MELERYRRIAKALAESERLNAELEDRVRQKQAELESTFEKLRQLARDAAIVEERQRIMADMHDGIGAQLISALNLAERDDASIQDVAAALRECLVDLRLAIDSLEPAAGDLLATLGNFRYRLDGQLQRLGVELDWQVRDLPALPGLTPGKLLHILRILQEAFANVLKHAHASRVRVETGVVPDRAQIFISVSDNGQGFVGQRGRGRGLGNMARRAAAVGGELRVSPSATGTTVDLLLPVG